MHAEPGDWLVVKGTVVDSPDEVGQIVEVRHADGELRTLSGGYVTVTRHWYFPARTRTW